MRASVEAFTVEARTAHAPIILDHPVCASR